MKFAHCLAAAALLAGCAQNNPQDVSAPRIETVALADTPISTAPGAIKRPDGVPNGVKNADGLTVPKGFKINVFAEDLKVPRRLVIAPGATPQKYDVFVAESKSNRVRVLRETNGDGRADQKFVFTDKADQPYGLAFWKNWLYVGNTNAIVRFGYQNGATKASSGPQKIAQLTRGGYNQHWTRNLLFSRDGQQLFATVGSSCNTCEEDDPQRAAISVMNPDGKNKRVFASGLRNPVGLAWRPNTNELWTAVNERDNLGDNVPPDYITRVEPGAFYGWPYAYTDINRKVHADPNFGDKKPDLVKKTVAPSVPVQAHSAALGIAFYPTFQNGEDVAGSYQKFPKEYEGDAFLTFHGSWNRSEKTGYKVVRVHFQNGKAVSVSDFLRGFLKNGREWGRPVDIQVAPDGSLLFSDDGRGKIWRISYAGK